LINYFEIIKFNLEIIWKWYIKIENRLRKFPKNAERKQNTPVKEELMNK